MTNYRSFIESKLAAVDERRAELERERSRLAAAISVLDEADASAGDTQQAAEVPASEENAGRNESLSDAILRCLTSSSKSMTQADIYKCLCGSRSVTRENMYASMYRLKKRNKICKSGKLWSLT